MTLIICICTYNRNSSLLKCLKSINNLYRAFNINIEVVVVDNSIKYNSFKTVKKIKKSFKYKIKQLHEKRRGIVYARNKFLYEVKKTNPKFICFFDDDCIVDHFWLKNVLKIKRITDAEIITGPQLSLTNRSLKNYNFINYPEFLEKTYKTNIKRVHWTATNNVFLEYSAIKKHKLTFDKNLNKFGVGEDQLFFSKLNSYGHKIYWSKTVKVYENIHKHRLNLNWLIRRSFRLGVVGHYIDMRIYGKLVGFVINYIKCIYYFIKSLSLLFLLFNDKFRIQITNYLSRSYGRLVGPLVLKKIDFFRK